MDGVQDLLVVVYLLGILVLFFLALGNGVYEEGHVVSETRADVLDRVGGVLHDVVEEGGDDGVGVEFQFFRRDVGDGDRVDDVGLAGFPLLAAVGLFGQEIGVLDPLQVLCADARGHHVKNVLCGRPNLILYRFFHNQGIKIVFFSVFWLILCNQIPTL